MNVLKIESPRCGNYLEGTGPVCQGDVQCEACALKETRAKLEVLTAAAEEAVEIETERAERMQEDAASWASHLRDAIEATKP